MVLSNDDIIDLRVDTQRVHVGGVVSGTVCLTRLSPTQSIKVTLEGCEYSVVALSHQNRDKHMGLEYLKKHTSEEREIIKKELLLDYSVHHEQRIPFRFVLPDDLPGTMRCILDGTDNVLPSQCHVYYKLTASIFQNTSKVEISKPIIIISRQNENIPIDSVISVAVNKPIETVMQSIFQCGSLAHVVENEDDRQNESHDVYNHFSLSCNQEDLKLAGGQVVTVKVTDWLGRQLTGTWMIQLIENTCWSSQGRTAHSQQIWDLFANHHEIPSNARPTYISSQSLIKIQHSLVVFLTTTKDDPSKEVLAKTKPLNLTIVSNIRGWEA